MVSMKFGYGLITEAKPKFVYMRKEQGRAIHITSGSGRAYWIDGVLVSYTFDALCGFMINNPRMTWWNTLKPSRDKVCKKCHYKMMHRVWGWSAM